VHELIGADEARKSPAFSRPVQEDGAFSIRARRDAGDAKDRRRWRGLLGNHQEIQ
jgi:hypothetical protein